MVQKQRPFATGRIIWARRERVVIGCLHWQKQVRKPQIPRVSSGDERPIQLVDRISPVIQLFSS